jgi:hypothetical protein
MKSTKELTGIEKIHLERLKSKLDMPFDELIGCIHQTHDIVTSLSVIDPAYAKFSQDLRELQTCANLLHKTLPTNQQDWLHVIDAKFSHERTHVASSHYKERNNKRAVFISELCSLFGLEMYLLTMPGGRAACCCRNIPQEKEKEFMDYLDQEGLAIVSDLSFRVNEASISILLQS